MSQKISPEQAALEMALQLKKRDNPSFMGIQVGRVTKPFPDIEIAIGTSIVLDKSMLEFPADLLKGYKRKFNMTTSYTDPKIVGSIQLKSDTSPVDPLVKLTLETKEDGTSTCTLEYVDELQIGDEVVIMPTQDHGTFYVMHKVGRL